MAPKFLKRSFKKAASNVVENKGRALVLAGAVGCLSLVSFPAAGYVLAGAALGYLGQGMQDTYAEDKLKDDDAPEAPQP